MTGHDVLVEVVVVDLDFGVGLEVVWHEQTGRRHVHQLVDGVVDSPHEHGQKRLLNNPPAYLQAF